MLQFFRQIAHPKNGFLFPSKNSHLLSSKNFFLKRGFAAFSRTQKLPFESHSEVKEFRRVLYRKLEEHNKVYSENAQLFLKSGELEPAKLEEARVKMAEVEQHHTAFEQLHNLLTGMEEIQKMKKETPEKDIETHELLDEEMENSEDLLEEVEAKAIELLVPPDQYDDCNSINIEIRPGVGGSESSLFADDILQMYQAYLPTRGFKFV